MSGHTPGPWIARKAKKADAEGEFSAYVFAEGYGVVGYWRGHKSYHTDHNWLLTDADARLIAAAPELLAALQMALNYHRDDDVTALHIDVSKAARAAIAKATGETP